ncbi:MAG: 4'-phosphopantetheinyl transferase family protein [Eubacteriales bacterium]
MITIYLRKTDASAKELSKIAHRLLRERLEQLGFSSLPEIVKNAYNKPYFAGNELYFSLSHTPGAVAVGLSNAEIGLDLQAVRPISPAVMVRYLGSHESDPRICTRLWTEFEAYGKYLGCGIPIVLPERSHECKSYDLGSYILTVCAEKIGEICVEWI